MLTIDALRAFGANTDEGLARCFQKEDFYLRLVKTMPGDTKFDEMAAAVERGDLAEGFELAHSLKGVLGNLSLTPLYEPVCQITELLRARTETDYSALLGEILRQRDALKVICAE